MFGMFVLLVPLRDRADGEATFVAQAIFRQLR